MGSAHMWEPSLNQPGWLAGTDVILVLIYSNGKRQIAINWKIRKAINEVKVVECGVNLNSITEEYEGYIQTTYRHETVLHCTWYACNTVRVSYAYIRAEQFPGRIVRLRVLVLYRNVEIRVSGLLPLGIPARGWSCPPMLKGPIEHNACTQID